jgi:hypothetical protein
VLNATILANYDACRRHLSYDTLAVLQDMWAQQQTTGEESCTWHWLQLDLEPWEANDS